MLTFLLLAFGLYFLSKRTAFRLEFAPDAHDVHGTQNTLSWTAESEEAAEGFVNAVQMFVLGSRFDVDAPSPRETPRTTRDSPSSDTRSASTVVTEPDIGTEDIHDPPSLRSSAQKRASHSKSRFLRRPERERRRKSIELTVSPAEDGWDEAHDNQPPHSPEEDLELDRQAYVSVRQPKPRQSASTTTSHAHLSLSPATLPPRAPRRSKTSPSSSLQQADTKESRKGYLRKAHCLTSKTSKMEEKSSSASTRYHLSPEPDSVWYDQEREAAEDYMAMPRAKSARARAQRSVTAPSVSTSRTRRRGLDDRQEVEPEAKPEPRIAAEHEDETSLGLGPGVVESPVPTPSTPNELEAAAARVRPRARRSVSASAAQEAQIRRETRAQISRSQQPQGEARARKMGMGQGKNKVRLRPVQRKWKAKPKRSRPFDPRVFEATLLQGTPYSTIEEAFMALQSQPTISPAGTRFRASSGIQSRSGKQSPDRDCSRSRSHSQSRPQPRGGPSTAQTPHQPGELRQGEHSADPDLAPDLTLDLGGEDDPEAWAEAAQLLSAIGYGLTPSGSSLSTHISRTKGRGTIVHAADVIGNTLRAELSAAEEAYRIGLLGAVGGPSKRLWRSTRTSGRDANVYAAGQGRGGTVQERILATLRSGGNNIAESAHADRSRKDSGADLVPKPNIWSTWDAPDFDFFSTDEVDSLLDQVDASLDQLEGLSALLDSAQWGMKDAGQDVRMIRKARHGNQLHLTNSKALEEELQGLLSYAQDPLDELPVPNSPEVHRAPFSVSAPGPARRSRSHGLPFRSSSFDDDFDLSADPDWGESRMGFHLDSRPDSPMNSYTPPHSGYPMGGRKSIDVARLERKRTREAHAEWKSSGPRRSMDVKRVHRSRRSMDVLPRDSRPDARTRRSMDVDVSHDLPPRRSMDPGRRDRQSAAYTNEEREAVRGQEDFVPASAGASARFRPRHSLDVSRRPGPRRSIDPASLWEDELRFFSQQRDPLPPRKSMDVSTIQPAPRKSMDNSTLRATPRLSMDVSANRSDPNLSGDPRRSALARPSMDTIRASARLSSRTDMTLPAPKPTGRSPLPPPSLVNGKGADALHVLLSSPLTAQGNNVIVLEAAAVEVYKHFLAAPDPGARQALAPFLGRFGQRFTTFAQQMLSAAVSRPVSAAGPVRTSTSPPTQQSLPQGMTLSKAIETALEPYCGMVLFLRETIPGSYHALKQGYAAAVRGACYNVSQWEGGLLSSVPPSATGAEVETLGGSPTTAGGGGTVVQAIRLIYAVVGFMAAQHSFVIDLLHLSSVQITFADYSGLEPVFLAQASRLRQVVPLAPADTRPEPLLDDIFAPAVQAVGTRTAAVAQEGLSSIALLAGLESALSPSSRPDAPPAEGMDYALIALSKVRSMLAAHVDQAIQKEVNFVHQSLEAAPFASVPSEWDDGKAGLGRKLTLKRRSSAGVPPPDSEVNEGAAYVLPGAERVPWWIAQVHSQVNIAIGAGTASGLMSEKPVLPPPPKATMARLGAACTRLTTAFLESIAARSRDTANQNRATAASPSLSASCSFDILAQVVEVVNLEAVHFAASCARAKAHTGAPLDMLLGRCRPALHKTVEMYATSLLQPDWGLMREFVRLASRQNHHLQMQPSAHFVSLTDDPNFTPQAWEDKVDRYSPEFMLEMIHNLSQCVCLHLHLPAPPAATTSSSKSGSKKKSGQNAPQSPGKTSRCAQLVWSALARRVSSDVEQFRTLAIEAFRDKASSPAALDVLAWSVDASSVQAWFRQLTPVTSSSGAPENA